MRGRDLRASLKVVVRSDVMEVALLDDGGPPRLHLGHHASQDPPSDRDLADQGAFLVDAGGLGALLGHLEAWTDVLIISQELLPASLS